MDGILFFNNKSLAVANIKWLGLLLKMFLLKIAKVPIKALWKPFCSSSRFGQLWEQERSLQSYGKIAFIIKSWNSLLLVGEAIESGTGNMCCSPDVGEDGFFGGDEHEIWKVSSVIFIRKSSICFNDRALCRVSSGRMPGTPGQPPPAIIISRKSWTECCNWEPEPEPQTYLVTSWNFDFRTSVPEHWSSRWWWPCWTTLQKNLRNMALFLWRAQTLRRWLIPT